MNNLSFSILTLTMIFLNTLPSFAQSQDSNSNLGLKDFVIDIERIDPSDRLSNVTRAEVDTGLLLNCVTFSYCHGTFNGTTDTSGMLILDIKYGDLHEPGYFINAYDNITNNSLSNVQISGSFYSQGDHLSSDYTVNIKLNATHDGYNKVKYTSETFRETGPFY